MKTSKIVITGAVAALMSASAFSQTVINLTGATAFRAASHAAIKNSLQGAQLAWTGHQDLSGANRAIFKGTIGGQEYIIRTSWSGSGDGIKALVNSTPVEVLAVTTAVTTAGQRVESAVFESATAQFSFSDVAQAATDTPSPSLEGTPVGVVPFMFVANKGAVGTGLTNITSQQFGALYSGGGAPLSLFTGAPADAAVAVIPTGRASSSGTRITVLAETGFGIYNPVQQYTITASVDENDKPDLSVPITWDDAEFAENNGYSSNSFIRDLMQRDTAQDGPIVVGYLTVSDALAAVNGGAQALTYNGVPYSVENVQNGSYTLWGYQQFFNISGLNTQQQAFKTALLAALPTSLGSAGIGIPSMNVQRSGGEGGQILPIGDE